jgi:hypothetical protein
MAKRQHSEAADHVGCEDDDGTQQRRQNASEKLRLHPVADELTVNNDDNAYCIASH